MTSDEFKSRFPNGLRVELPLPRPELSPNARVFWGKKANVTKAARARAKFEGLRAYLPARSPMLSRAVVQIHWFKRTLHESDQDNALASCKAYFDGFADAGIFTNDRGIIHLPIVFEKDAANPRLVMHITAYSAADAIEFVKAKLSI